MQNNAGVRQFHFGSSLTKDWSGQRGRPTRVLLLGQPDVGKTAISVRFACRRFIGSYDSSCERLYRVDNEWGSWELADPPAGEPSQPPGESRMRWAEAVLLVYSVADRVSFDETWRLRFLMSQARKSARRLAPPLVVLVANKSDRRDRMVSTDEGSQRARDIHAHGFHEISARESVDQVMAVFASLSRLAILEHHGLTHQSRNDGSFRTRASTDSSIDARRRAQPALVSRRLSISARGTRN